MNTEHPKLKKNAKRVLIVAFVLAVVAVPGLLLTMVGANAAMTCGTFAAVCALIATFAMDWRAGILATTLLAVTCGLIMLFEPIALLCALVLAALAFLVGYSAKRGMSANLIMVVISAGFIVVQPPTLHDSKIVNALLVVLVIAIAGVWATAITWFIARNIPHKEHEHLHTSRAVAYGVMLAILVGIATWISVKYALGHAGGWFILTIAIVLQPYLQEAMRKTVHRSVGTILGFGIAFIIGIFVTEPFFLYLAGTVCLFFAISFFTDPKRPYWLYVMFLTPTIVVFESAGGSITGLARERLFATLGGVAIALIAEAIMIPVYRSAAHKHNLDHY